MRASKRVLGLVGLIALPLASGCVMKSTYLKQVSAADQLKADKASLNNQIQALQDQIKKTESDLAAAKSDNDQLMKSLEAKKGELSQRVAELTKENQDLTQQLRETEQAKEAEIAKLKGSYDQLVGGLQDQLKAGEVTITQLKGRLSVNMVDKILFDSGEAMVKPAGQKVLQSVGEVLKKLADKDIRIEGYTDNVPISPSLQAKYPTNWELSTARATAVVRYLQDHAGIAPDRLIAVGYGENHALAANDTPEGRQQNRRIEIVLVPHETAEAPAPAPAATPAAATSK